MGRNCISRHVQSAPVIKGFRPFGRFGNRKQKIVLSLDEYEVIRLLDYEHLNQEEAAVKMQISRSTLTRIYERARIKFATALVEGSILLIEGGEINLKNHMYHCNHCHNEIQSSEAEVLLCPQCNSSQIDSLDDCHQKECKQCKKCHHGGRYAKT